MLPINFSFLGKLNNNNYNKDTSCGVQFTALADVLFVQSMVVLFKKHGKSS